MISAVHDRKSETLVYLCLWLLVAGVFVLDVMRARATTSLPLLDVPTVARMSLTLLPFLGLFLLNNAVLIPRLLMRNRTGLYFLCAAVAVVALWVYQYFSFMAHEAMRPHPELHNPHIPRPLVPLPVFLDFIYALLVIGVNLAVALMFQRYYDKLERESLMKANAESQLADLKAQINPHFYMNMLNNIHGMIEIDPDRAQGMVIDMSQLMRHMLYESSQPVLPLSSEIAFLRNYLRLMRQRYPEDKVSITATFPSEAEMAGIMIAPLLFLVFIENAFKHGVSYRESSFVAVSVAVSGDSVRFSCMNSLHPSAAGAAKEGGIGLRNVSRRLSLIYGDRASLNIDNGPSAYTVNLAIPAQYETSHAYN